MYFEIGYDDFDTELLPESARDPQNDAFQQAVREYYQSEFSGLKGSLAVTFESDRVRVAWTPASEDRDLSDLALGLLERGAVEEAFPVLRALASVEPNNPTAHYNLGMMLSDRGEFDSAQLHLVKANRLDPENANILVALGVALYRSGNADGGIRRLQQAISLEPANGYAHRNLAAVLGNEGDLSEAIAHLRTAYHVLPDDLQTVFGLANALDRSEDRDLEAEADELYIRAIELGSDTPIGEMARQARSKIAQRTMRRNGGDLRPDAVMYCLGALKRFATMNPLEVQGVGYEIAVLGERGIDVNDSRRRYPLQTLPGEFSGLQLMSLMYVAFKQVAPTLDIGFDLSGEYEAATAMFGSQSQ